MCTLVCCVSVWRPYKAIIGANCLCSFELEHVDVRNDPLMLISQTPLASVLTAVNDAQDSISGCLDEVLLDLSR